MLNLDKDYLKFFPKNKYSLTDLQKKSICNVVEKANTLCILPTGSGKSDVYWMSGVELGGITVVVSPLIALIAEQAQKLTSHGYEVLQFHGGVNAAKQMKILTSIARGEYSPDFVFVSPEKIATDGYFEYCLKRRKEDVKLLVIDEVHCVSQWGISFRPFYKRIPDFLNNIFGDEWCRVLALTATLNPKEIDDICSSFKITRENIIKAEILMRSEIQLHVKKFHTEEEKEAHFWDLIKIHEGEKTLVYIYRKQGTRSVEDLNEKAIDRGYRSVWFHGEMSSDERQEIVEQFKNGKVDIVFATNAFGMGIDIPDIRNVIHFMLPESAEQYYQEVGRAARDKNGANAYLFYSNKNIEVKREYFIDGSFPKEETLRSVYNKLAKNTGPCVFQYFEDDEIQECLPYYLEAGLADIAGKGFSQLSELTDIKDPVLKEYYDSTKTHAFRRTLLRNSITASELTSRVYGALVDGLASVTKPLSRWLVLDIHDTEISDESMKKMLESIEEKKQYKHDLLNYFVSLLDDYSDSAHLHQEIGKYLGMNKHQLQKIYRTADGNMVRSKSEVIICNLLHQHGVKYAYEERLFYGNEGKWIEPDFTIETSDGKLYWEHVGMLGNEKYSNDWMHKLDVYTNYFPGKLIKTYETTALVSDALDIINSFN